MRNTNSMPKLNDARAAENRRRQGPLDNDTSEVLTRIYLARRLNYQLDYYRSKEREFTENSDNAFRAGAIVMSLTSVLAALGTADSAPTTLRLLTAILPAMAALVASFRALYQWDRQAQLYKDTALGLERAKLVLPDLDQVDTHTAAKIFPELVSTTELVFEDEVNQWGQIALGEEDKEAETNANIEKFAREYGLDVFDGDGNLDVAKLGTFKDILMVAQSRQNPSLSVEYPTVSAGETDPDVQEAEEEPEIDMPTDETAEPDQQNDITNDTQE